MKLAYKSKYKARVEKDGLAYYLLTQNRRAGSFVPTPYRSFSKLESGIRKLFESGEINGLKFDPTLLEEEKERLERIAKEYTEGRR